MIPDMDHCGLPAQTLPKVHYADCVAFKTQRQNRFATDSPLEGDGFKLLVPGRETVKPSWGDRTAVLTTSAELSRNRWFESVFLQQ